MVTIAEAQTQVAQQRSQIAQAQSLSQQQLRNIEEATRKVPDYSSQKALRQTYSGQTGQVKRSMFQKIKERLLGQKQQTQQFQKQLTQYETGTLQPFEQQIQEAQQSQEQAQQQAADYNYAVRVYLGQTSGSQMNRVSPAIKAAAQKQAESMERGSTSMFVAQINKFQQQNPTEKLLVDWNNLQIKGVESGVLGQTVSLDVYNKIAQGFQVQPTTPEITYKELSATNVPGVISQSKVLDTSNFVANLVKQAGGQPRGLEGYQTFVQPVLDKQQMSTMYQPKDLTMRDTTGVYNINVKDFQRDYSRESYSPELGMFVSTSPTGTKGTSYIRPPTQEERIIIERANYLGGVGSLKEALKKDTYGEAFKTVFPQYKDLGKELYLKIDPREKFTRGLKIIGSGIKEGGEAVQKLRYNVWGVPYTEENIAAQRAKEEEASQTIQFLTLGAMTSPGAIFGRTATTRIGGEIIEPEPGYIGKYAGGEIPIGDKLFQWANIEVKRTPIIETKTGWWRESLGFEPKVRVVSPGKTNIYEVFGFENNPKLTARYKVGSSGERGATNFGFAGDISSGGMTAEEVSKFGGPSEFLLKRMAELKTGVPTSLELAPKMFESEDIFSIGRIKGIDLVKKQPYYESGVLSRIKQIKEYPSGMELYRVRAISKDITNPLYRKTGKTPAVTGTYVRLPRIGGEETGVEILKPANIKHTPLDKTFAIQKQIPEPLMAIPEIKPPTALLKSPKPSINIENLGAVTLEPRQESAYAGTGLYERTESYGAMIPSGNMKDVSLDFSSFKDATLLSFPSKTSEISILDLGNKTKDALSFGNLSRSFQEDLTGVSIRDETAQVPYSSLGNISVQQVTTKQVQQPKIATPSIQTPNIKTPKPRPPKKPEFIIPKLPQQEQKKRLLIKDKLGKTPKGAFDVYTRVRGKEKLIASRVTKKAALDIGAATTLWGGQKATALSASIILKPTRGPARNIVTKGEFGKVSNMFRIGKVKGKGASLTLVQRETKRLGTRKERQAIIKARKGGLFSLK